MSSSDTPPPQGPNTPAATQPIPRRERHATAGQAGSDPEATKPMDLPRFLPSLKRKKLPPILLLGLIGFLTMVVIIVATTYQGSTIQPGITAQSSDLPQHIGFDAPAPKLLDPQQRSDWPGFLYNGPGTSWNPNETVINPVNAARLQLVSTYSIGETKLWTNAIVSTIASVGNLLYFGAWDGNYYAITNDTHKLVWKVAMGVVTPPKAKGCNPPFAGISSKATIIDGILYVGGPDGKVYALNAQTGATVWATQVTAVIPAHEGYPATDLSDEFLWSSPAIGNGRVYIGIASYGDCPLVGGHIMMLDQKSGAVQATHWTEKENAGGVTIWNRPVLDPADNAVLYATGSLSSGPESDAIVELDWNTLAVKSIWQVPLPDQGENNAFGASCTLVPDIAGSRGIVCHSKATRIYGVQITPDGLKSAWRRVLGTTDGQAPEYGQADVGECSFDGTNLYVGASRVIDLHGQEHRGAVYSIRATDGQVNWIQYFNKTDGYPETAIAGANGILAVGMANEDQPGSLQVLEAKTGKILTSYPVSATVYGAPIINNGRVYVPTSDGRIYVFGVFDGAPAGTVFNTKSLASYWHWINADATHARLTGSTLQIDAAGMYSVDAQNMLATGSPTSDFALTAQLRFQPKIKYEQAGLTAFVDRNNYLKLDLINLNPDEIGFEFSTVIDGQLASAFAPNPFPKDALIHLQLIRLDSTYYAYGSVDGAHWVLLFEKPLLFTPTLKLVGLFATTNEVKKFDKIDVVSLVLTPLTGRGEHSVIVSP